MYDFTMTVSALHTASERLNECVSQVVGVLNRAHAQLVEATAELIETGAWAGGGILSPTHWLMLRAGLSRARACQVVELAKRAHELPATMATMASGEISIEQATPIARHVPPEFEESVAKLARHATVPQVTRAASRSSFHTHPADDSGDTGGSFTPPPLDQPQPVAPPRLTMHHRLGRFYLHYNAPSDIGALHRSLCP